MTAITQTPAKGLTLSLPWFKPAAPADASPSVAGDRVELSGSPAARLAYGMKDADYGAADPGEGRRGPVRQLQVDLAKIGCFKSKHGATGGYFAATREAVMRLQSNHDLPATGRMDTATAAALAKDLAQVAKGQPATKPCPAVPDVAKPVSGARGVLTGLGLQKDGLTIPNNGGGRATTFWNGHYTYKGMRDKNNMSIGAWGDQNRPTEYFVALPVGKRAWHNQKILLTNPQTGAQVVALVQDKGPGKWTGAKIDLSPVTMEALGGHYNGEMYGLKYEFAPADAPVGPVKR